MSSSLQDVFETFGCRSAGHCIEWTHISLLHWRLLSFHSLKGLAPFTVPHLQEPRHCQLFNQCDPPTSALTLHHIASKWEALGKRQLSSISEELTFLSVLGYFGGIPQEKWSRQRQKSHTPICSASMIRVFRPRVSREKKSAPDPTNLQGLRLNSVLNGEPGDSSPWHWFSDLELILPMFLEWHLCRAYISVN